MRSPLSHGTQQASEVLAPEGDIDIHARQIDVRAASNSQRLTETCEYRKSAVGGSVSVPLINTIMSLASMAQSSNLTRGPRMKALAAATLAMQAKTVADSAQAVAASGSLGGVKVTVSVGRSTNESRSTQASQSVVGSTVAAGRDARLTASGGGWDSDAPKEVLLGDLTVTGSTVNAGKKLSLIADEELRLQAVANTAEMKNTNRNSNSSLGVGFAFGGAQNGWTLELAASKGRGHADGNDLAWTNTHVNAGDQLLLQSGGDTTLKGAVARAPQADVYHA